MLKPLDLLAGRSSEATLRAHVSFLPHHRAGALLPENTGDSSPHFLVVFQLRAPPYSLESIEYPDPGKSKRVKALRDLRGGMVAGSFPPSQNSLTLREPIRAEIPL